MITGVDVPGLPNRIPDLLFADDAVVLADSAENLQISLYKISTWSELWEMKLNASKSAKQLIKKTDQYTYLAYVMNSK
ncbi:hypothetical protein AYI70_g1671 [Smittium culicis]|uniref:Reverse transcriptase domain-containing protein n=1 Tax=Smittium culicis TaxID=133412 RepID=A0A1R1YBU8_9FUNG|nr:hypothetical protein AYI70_g1671 [Smittium culicis]